MNKKRITSQDVAEKAGVSRTTVSFVLNEVQNVQISQATREKVFQAAEELGYVPDEAARSLASGRNQFIGLLLTRSSHQLASDAFFTQILDELIEVIHRFNLRIMIDIVEPHHQLDAYLNLVKANRIDGILLSGPRLDDDALRTLEKTNFPTVLMGQLPGTDFCWVDIDNRGAAKSAVVHLIDLGHRRIACVTNAHLIYTAAIDRLEGYRQALEGAGIGYDPDLVRYGDFDINSGYLQVEDLLRRNAGFSAIFVASDTLALGAVAAIRDRGLRIPDDIAVVGFDDLPFAQYLDPPLTSVHLPIKDLAREAGEMLIRILNHEGSSCQRKILETSLRIRRSSDITLKA